MRRLSTTVVALAAALLLPGAVVAAAPANASDAPAQAAPSGPHHWMYTDDDNPGGRVDFWPKGDVVKVCDIEGDGRWVDLGIWNKTKDPDTFEYYIHEFYDDGECKTFRAGDGPRYNLAEGHCFRFRIRLMKDNNVVDGSADTAKWRNDNNEKRDCPGVD